LETTLRNILSLKVGEQANIKGLAANHCACKLMTLGLLPKANIKIIRKSPFGETLLLKINDHYIAVRKSEAATILIE
jgi:Fe2+ transport system protein FeoA